MSESLLQMRGIVKTFDGVKALDGINLVVKPGECVGLCGENGAGKSTLMKVLSGVYPSGTWDGEILWEGRPLHASGIRAVSYTHLTLPTTCTPCRSRWSPYH